MAAMKDKKILVVGGYGGVGRTIATILSDELPKSRYSDLGPRILRAYFTWSS